jgi:hypothetical protein
MLPAVSRLIPEQSPPKPLSPARETILRDLSRYHYLTAQQVQRLHYASGSITYVQSMLKRLAEEEYCQRVWLPRASQFGSAPSVYRLARKGLNLLREQGLEVERRHRPSEHVAHSYLFLNHTLAVNDFLISAELVVGNLPGYGIARVVHEQELKRRPFYVELDGGRQAVIPDAWLDFRVRGTYQACLALELDMGTESQKRWRRKVRALLAFANGPYQEAFATRSLTVAVVATSGERRLADLLGWTEEELRAAGEEQNASLFLFVACSPADVLPSDLFFGRCWYEPYGQQPLALFEGVD